MTDALPVPIFPWPTSEHGDWAPLEPERAALLRQAKSQIDTQIQMYPVPATAGSPGRTLAFGSVPPWYSESVIIREENVENVDSIARALKFLLTAPAGSPGSFSHEMWLQAVMGAGVKFLYEESMVPERPRPDSPRFY